MIASPTTPSWITKRDGRLVPFEPEKVCRTLFAATEAVGRPDAFLARELTDGVLHFLAAEADPAPPSTAALTELIQKVVRELGHPALARAFGEVTRRRQGDKETRRQGDKECKQESPPGLLVSLSPCLLVSSSVPRPAPDHLAGRLAGACLRAYSLESAYPRDLVAAHRDGLLTLTGLETPLELAGCVLRPQLPSPGSAGMGLLEAITEARALAGQFVAIDGPEYALAALQRDDPARLAAEYARELRFGLRATGLAAVVNLNSALPPTWAADADGPLFRGLSRPVDESRRDAVADALLEELFPAELRSDYLPTPPEEVEGEPCPRTEQARPPSASEAAPVRVAWHLGEADFRPEVRARLVHVAGRALAGAAVEFVFDRPRRGVVLGPGLERRQPAALLLVGVHLPRLLEQIGGTVEPELFLRKLGCLARLAKGAGHVRQDYLRRHARPEALQGFLVDRARLVAVPVGLEAAVRSVLGRGVGSDAAASDFARRVVLALRTALEQDRPGCLETCLDSPLKLELPRDGAAENESEMPAPGRFAGVTSCDSTLAPKQQVRLASRLHSAAAGGTGVVLVPPDRPFPAEQAADLLRNAWQGDAIRLRFVRATPAARQLTAPFGE